MGVPREEAPVLLWALAPQRLVALPPVSALQAEGGNLDRDPGRRLRGCRRVRWPWAIEFQAYGLGMRPGPFRAFGVFRGRPPLFSVFSVTPW